MKKTDDFKELNPEQLLWRAPLEKIPFETSDDCEVSDDIIGQERALKAIQVGLDIKNPVTTYSLPGWLVQEERLPLNSYWKN